MLKLRLLLGLRWQIYKYIDILLTGMEFTWVCIEGWPSDS